MFNRASKGNPSPFIYAHAAKYFLNWTEYLKGVKLHIKIRMWNTEQYLNLYHTKEYAITKIESYSNENRSRVGASMGTSAL